MDRFNDFEAFQILDHFILKHTNMEAFDEDGDILVCCSGCGEILDYGITLADLENDPWECRDLQKLKRLMELMHGARAE